MNRNIHYYGFTFQYREVKDGEPKTDCIFIDSRDPDITNACEIAMLRYVKEHNYYSGKLIKTIEY